MYTEESEWRN